MKRSSGPQGKDIRKFFRSSPAVEKSSSTVEKSSTVAKENDARVSPQAHCDDCANKVSAVIQNHTFFLFCLFGSFPCIYMDVVTCQNCISISYYKIN